MILRDCNGIVLYECSAKTIGEAFLMAKDDEVSLAGLRIRDEDLGRVDIEGMDFRQCDFMFCTVARAKFVNCAFTSGTFLNVGVLSSMFTDCDFRYADLGSCVMNTCILDKSDFSNSNLYHADLSGSSVYECNFSGANLEEAQMMRVSGIRVNFRDAQCRNAVFNNAALHQSRWDGANLCHARMENTGLGDATGLSQVMFNQLEEMRYIRGTQYAFKLVDANYDSVFADTKIHYTVGETISVAEYDTDESNVCAPGIHVATLQWCMRCWCPGLKILVVSFEPEDIVAIPTNSDGVFRVKKCNVVEELHDRSVYVRTGKHDWGDY